MWYSVTWRDHSSLQEIPAWSFILKTDVRVDFDQESFVLVSKALQMQQNGLEQTKVAVVQNRAFRNVH